MSGQYSGAFGIVLQVKQKQTNQPLACKYIVSTLSASLFVCLSVSFLRVGLFYSIAFHLPPLLLAQLDG